MSVAILRFWREELLGLVTLAGLCGTFLLSPIAQDPAYHSFTDTRTILGLPNFWNVLSNVGFVFAGLFGLLSPDRPTSPVLRPGYQIFCIAVICVAFGSSFYHYAPSTPALVWDRLPMSLAFMALFALIIGDRLGSRFSRTLLFALLALGAGSVLYWAWTEGEGRGDLRPYGLVQFLPMILMPLMLLLFPGSRRSAAWLWGTFSAYLLAKLTEHFDSGIYAAIGLSGHSIKHLLSALAVLFAINAVRCFGSSRRSHKI